MMMKIMLLLQLKWLIVTLIFLHSRSAFCKKFYYSNEVYERPRVQSLKSTSLEHEKRTADDPSGRRSSSPPMPPPSEGARMARYIVHSTDWAALATTSAKRQIQSFPFVNTVSFSDGPPSNGSGIPYLYLTPLDMSSQDLEKDARSSLAMTLAETSYCENNAFDPEDPRCAKVVLTGKVKKLKPESSELVFAENALFTRHPAMKTWPTDHNWYFAKMKIDQIILLDYFGGPKNIPVKEYLAVSPEVSRASAELAAPPPEVSRASVELAPPPPEVSNESVKLVSQA
ncbi:protein CREG1-like [Bacillus rossius redtenbacheri]|uniref:protein CREG1-like n=1 Tax=Bacillus rossius redtenbacheri TaxID=93214 RepID=UPI002FDDBADC